MTEEEVMNKLSGEGSNKQPENTGANAGKTPENNTKYSKEYSKEYSKKSINDEITERKQEEENKRKEEERLQRLADAKAIIDRINPDDFFDKELAIEAKVFKEKVKDLGREQVAEKLERLSIVDAAKKDLEAAKRVKGYSETTRKQLEKIVSNKDSFNIESAKETLQRSDEILQDKAKQNVGSKSALSNVDLDSLSNKEYFAAKNQERIEKIHKSVHDFFSNYNGYMEGDR